MSENPIDGATATAVAPEPPPEARPVPTTETGLETWTVPLSQIDAEGSPFRFRRTLKPDAKIKELASSIEAEGLLHPLVVRRVGEKFQLVSGFRRHAALTYLARTKGTDPSDFPVKVSVLWEGTTDDEALHVAFAENLARKTLDSTEKAMAVLKLRDEFGKSLEEIADLVRVTPRQLNRLTELVAAPEDVREAFRLGKFGLEPALALARVADASTREMLIRRAGVKRLRTDAVAGAIIPEGGPDGDGPSEAVPEAARGFVRVAPSANSERPFRLTALLRTAEEAARVARYLVRYA